MRKTNPKAMPHDHQLPETRAEAKTDRAAIVSEILDIPSKLEGKTARWFIIFLVMLVFTMGAAALFYQQKQMAEMRAETVSIREESNVLRKQLTDYLVVANVSTTGALDRNTAALSENTRILNRIEQVIDRLKN